MIYIFDSSTLIDLFRYYYTQRFPSLWERFNDLVKEQRIISVREVYNEIKDRGDNLSDWAKSHKELFKEATSEELNFIAEIFKIPHFQMLIKQKARYQGRPVADPFVIALALINHLSVVTAENLSGSAERPKIPDVCEALDIRWLNMIDLFREQGLHF